MQVLAGEDTRVSVSCQEKLTVEYILINYADYVHVRYQCVGVSTLGELFNTISHNAIIQFMHRAGLFFI